MDRHCILHPDPSIELIVEGCPVELALCQKVRVFECLSIAGFQKGGDQGLLLDVRFKDAPVFRGGGVGGFDLPEATLAF
jgi:hypothetical protein